MAQKTTTPAASHTRSSKAATGSKAAQAQAPQAPLYKVGTLPPVRPGTHRHYAQQVALNLNKKHRNGFTLLQYRNALVAGAAASSVAPPTGGWAKHNMPTWCAGQGWLVLAKAPAKAPTKAKAKAAAPKPQQAAPSKPQASQQAPQGQASQPQAPQANGNS